LKIITRKASKYDDERKLITYLARQGFSFDDIQAALTEYNELV
jgi:SOS response regulatory protein OraA/RecX